MNHEGILDQAGRIHWRTAPKLSDLRGAREPVVDD